MDQLHIVKHQVEIKAQKTGQGCRRTHTENINIPCVQNGLNRCLKGAAVNFVQRHADFINIRGQNGAQDILVTHTVTGNLHTLHSCQLIANHFLQCLLQLRITAIAKLCCKTHNR